MANLEVAKSKNISGKNETGEKLEFLSLAEKLFSGFQERSRAIIRKRFGLHKAEKETLEKIGQRYDITRERVRQIISEAMKNIANNSGREYFVQAEEKIIFTIEANGGIIKETEIAKIFRVSDPREINAIGFFADCSKKIFAVKEKGLLEKSWAVSKELADWAKKIVIEAEKIVQDGKKLLTDEEIFEKLIAGAPHISKDQALSFLSASKKVKKNKFEKWGIADWMEVTPKGTREKIYLILNEYKKPLHFTKIAEMIDEHKLGKRKAHPQTVHNELIKDERFVLIGRGIYALREWGYFSGTIKDIIKIVLEKSGRPMKKEEITAEVLKMRKAKDATVAINLNNRKFFEKKGELYSLKSK